jgi:hypothetical protein
MFLQAEKGKYFNISLFDEVSAYYDEDIRKYRISAWKYKTARESSEDIMVFLGTYDTVDEAYEKIYQMMDPFSLSIVHLK